MINEEIRRILLNLDFFALFKKLSPDGTQEMLLGVMESCLLKDKAPIENIKDNGAKWCAEMWFNDIEISFEIRENKRQRLSGRGRKGAAGLWNGKRKKQPSQPDIPFVEAEEVERYPFEEFWNLYDKKRNRTECEKLWRRLSDEAKAQIMVHAAEYVAATTEKIYRRDPYNYLSQRGWEDEIIPQGNGNNHIQQDRRSEQQVNEAKCAQTMARMFADLERGGESKRHSEGAEDAPI